MGYAILEKRGSWRRFVCRVFGHEWTAWLRVLAFVGGREYGRVRACYRCQAEERLLEVHEISDYMMAQSLEKGSSDEGVGGQKS
jgi:hypothetical protein